MFKCEKHVHCSLLPQIFPKCALWICCIRKTVNHHYYHHTLLCLWENVWWKQIKSGTLGMSFSSTKHTRSFCLSVHNFLAQNKITIIPHIFTHQTQHCVTYFFSQNPRWHKEKENKWDHHDCSKIMQCTWWVSNNALHKMVQMVVWTLGQPNKVPRRTLKGKTLIGRQVLLSWRNTFSPENIWVQHI